MPKLKSLPILAAAAALTIAGVTALPAHADLVLSGGTPAASFSNLGAQGFGNDPRLLTEQTHPFESGFVTPVNVANGDAIPNNGGNKSNTPTLSALGWTSGAQVGIGFDADQSGGAAAGITLDTMTLTLYNGTTAVDSFSLASPVNFTANDLAMEQGNGNAVFNFKLTQAEQLQFNMDVANFGLGLFAGLGAAFGCDATHFTGCQFPANDGPDSFIGFAQSAVVPAPLIGHGLPVLVGFAGILFGARLFERYKRHRSLNAAA